MESRKIEFQARKARLSEIYSGGLQYAFYSKDGRQAHPFVLCKDYLHDAVYSTVNNEAIEVYGFSYSPKVDPAVDLETMRMLVVNAEDPQMVDKIVNVLDFINQFEKHFKLRRTRAYRVENPPDKYKACGAVAFEGSGRWLIAPPMVSLYTLLLRAGFSHTKGEDAMETIKNLIAGKIDPYQRNDASYLRQSKTAIDNILKLGYRVFFFGDIKDNYNKEVSVNTLHGSGGIVALANGFTKSVCKHWTRKQIQERLDGTYVPKEKIVEVPE